MDGHGRAARADRDPGPRTHGRWWRCRWLCLPVQCTADTSVPWAGLAPGLALLPSPPLPFQVPSSTPFYFHRHLTYLAPVPGHTRPTLSVLTMLSA